MHPNLVDFLKRKFVSLFLPTALLKMSVVVSWVSHTSFIEHCAVPTFGTNVRAQLNWMKLADLEKLAKHCYEVRPSIEPPRVADYKSAFLHAVASTSNSVEAGSALSVTG